MLSFLKRNNQNKNSELSGRNMIKYFDEEAYLEANQDVKEGIDHGQFKSVLHHLETFGFREIELGLRQFHRDFKVFDEKIYLDLFDDVSDAVDNGQINKAFEHFCWNGYFEIINRKRYWEVTTDHVFDKPSEENLEINLALDNELKYLNPEDLHIYNSLSQYNIDWKDYADANDIVDAVDNPLLHYIQNWNTILPVLPNVFDTKLYIELYSDIAKNNINPLYHYMLNGRSEGRQGYLDIQDYVVDGMVDYQPNLETLVVVNHESSATGAPLLGLNIAQQLSDAYNIIHIVLKSSTLHSDFLESCEFMINDIENEVIVKKIMEWIRETRGISTVICNSVETYAVLKASSELNFPTISLVHEFANYTRPIGKLSDSVFHADKVIVPANIIKESLYEELKLTANIKNELNNFIVLPQGKLPYIPEGYGDDLSAVEIKSLLDIDDSTKVIIGAGFVQMRKGVDLFIEMAKYIKERYKGKCKFIWVGGGYDPLDDLQYSVWLEKHIKTSGLEDDFTFLNHQKNLDNLLSISDVFALTSRLDPFPNVVVDALNSNVHVACFEKSTGCAEFMIENNANCTVVDYLDTNKMANAILDYWLNESNETFNDNKEIVQKKLNFDQYINSIKKCIDEVETIQKNNTRIVAELLETNEFDNDFYAFKNDIKEGCSFYVNNAQKGAYLYNSKPGFSEKKWLNSQTEEKRNVVPLYEALESGYSFTHEVKIIPYENSETIEFFYAVHLHLFYIELTDEFVEYFQNLPGKFDILITIVDKKDYETVMDAFSKCGANAIKIICVENIGRDVAPLLFSLKDDIFADDYHVIGHFHSKKSLDNLDGTGDRWRKYLMENLIGDKNITQSVLALFNDAKTGLVFTEDRHVVDIGENRTYIDNLCKMLKMDYINDTSLFPIGNMFWARPDAIKDLFTLEESEILEEEPLPYDGSYMHAIERILPAVTEKNNYKYITVYKEGTKW